MREVTVASDVSVHQLLITLEDTDPPVWRRLVVPSSYSLAKLHDALQAAFGWHDSHLHEFRIRDQVFSNPDFGDGWRHQALVERVSAVKRTRDVPALIDGERACPLRIVAAPVSSR